MVRKFVFIVFASNLLLMACSETDSRIIEPDTAPFICELELSPYEADNYTKWVDTNVRSEGSCRDTLIFISESHGMFYDCESRGPDQARYAYSGDTLKMQILKPVWEGDFMEMEAASVWSLIKQDGELIVASIKNKKDNTWEEMPPEGFSNVGRFKKVK